MGHKQVLLFKFGVDLGVMVTKRYSTFLQAPRLKSQPQDGLVLDLGHIFVCVEESYSFAEMQSMYFTAPADWAE